MGYDRPRRQRLGCEGSGSNLPVQTIKFLDLSLLRRRFAPAFLFQCSYCDAAKDRYVTFGKLYSLTRIQTHGWRANGHATQTKFKEI